MTTERETAAPRNTGRLVLGRKPGELVWIEGGIEIEVLECRGGRVRLGVVAPGRQVLRGELLPGGGEQAA